VTLACSSGWAQVHASAFVVGGQAVLVIGEKGAGKTSMLLTALAEGADFMSNDRVLLGQRDGAVVVRGLPHSVTVRAGTAAARIMADTSTTYGDHQPAGTGQVRYQITDVLSATGSSVCAEAGLGLLVLPHIVTGDITLERVAAAHVADLLEGARRRSTSSFDPLWDAWRRHVSDVPNWPGPSGVRLGYEPGDLRAAVKVIQSEVAR
jgi:hypothetical protein